jgi:hypothetical protein
MNNFHLQKHKDIFSNGKLTPKCYKYEKGMHFPSYFDTLWPQIQKENTKCIDELEHQAFIQIFSLLPVS